MSDFVEYKPMDVDHNVKAAVENLRKAYWSNEPEKVAKAFTEAEGIIVSAICHDTYTVCKSYDERPQNKWIKIFENPFTNGYICPFCGHKIQVTEQFLPQVTECESCGADMRGGAE